MKNQLKYLIPGYIYSLVRILLLISPVFVYSMLLQEAPVSAQNLRSLAGRWVYAKNGCSYCHTRYVQKDTWSMIRYATPGQKPRQSLYSFLNGNRRLGPDLQGYYSGKENRYYLEQKIYNPRISNENTIMPSYRHLFSQKAAEVEELNRYLRFSMGNSTTDIRTALKNETLASLLVYFLQEENNAF